MAPKKKFIIITDYNFVYSAQLSNLKYLFLHCMQLSNEIKGTGTCLNNLITYIRDPSRRGNYSLMVCLSILGDFTIQLFFKGFFCTI